MFCNFIEVDYGLYKCSRCGVAILSKDNMPPVFICNLALSAVVANDEPSFIQKIKNFAQSSIEHITSGMKLAEDSTIVSRYKTCQGCEFFNNETCTKCGCPLFSNKKYISKLSWADQECPVGKWKKETT